MRNLRNYSPEELSMIAFQKAKELMERLKNKTVFTHGKIKPPKRKDSRMGSIKNGNAV